MLTNITVFTPGVSTPDILSTDLDIPASNPAYDPIQVHSIDGLEPVPATINTAQYGSVDGEFYNGSYTGKRNIVLTVGLNPNWSNQSVEALRRILYQYFMPGFKTRLVLESTHMPTVQISGYVESIVPNIFSKDPEVQISIVCPSPFFESITSLAISGVTIPIADETMTEIDYAGDIAVGYVLDVVKGSASGMSSGEIRVINNALNSQLWDATEVAINTSFYLSLSTVLGDKYARAVPLDGGLATNLLGNVAPGSIWSAISPGTNNFQVMSSTPGQSWTLTYKPLYGGM